VRTIALLLEEE
jgi:hypothetical protein